VKRPKPVALIILDGWGEAPLGPHNAITSAHTPTWDRLMQDCPHTFISGSGLDVGLPVGQMGNSEVGHITMGSGRVIYQDLTLISQSIASGAFFDNTILRKAFAEAQNTQRAIHIMGLLSPGGVHSHEDHLLACLSMAASYGTPLYLHAFLDGRDTPPQSAKASIEKCEALLSTLPHARMASLGGRYFAMDRDERWERVQRAYEAIAHGNAPIAHSPLMALAHAYARGETDEFVTPTCVVPPGEQPVAIQPGDTIIYMNFRADRARALTKAFVSPDFTGFARAPIALGNFVTLTEYDSAFPVNIAYPSTPLHNVLGEYLQNKGLTQFRIAETEKYAHVTFFFNGGREAPFIGETRSLIASPQVATYDLQPEMHALAITEKLVAAILSQQYDFLVCNYANADMVGHTGNFEATVVAIEMLDRCLQKIIAALDTVQGQALITADHGNAECMKDPLTQENHTAHTTSLVPLVLIGKNAATLPPGGTLADIAPTVLTLLDLPIPEEMTGHSLINC